MISTRQGPAGQCGQISVGDLLHGIGDHPVYELDPAQTTALILGSPGSEISLWISDADYDPDAEETGAPAEGTFAALDKDGSNDIDMDEFRKALQQAEPSITEAEIERRFKELDTNEDGGISREEFNAASQAIAGVPTGIGIQFSKTGPGPFTIQGVTPGGSAELCGLIAVGDLLHGVGDKPVYDLNPQQTTELILGPAGSDITLWISKAWKAGEASQPVTEVKLKRNGYAPVPAQAQLPQAPPPAAAAAKPTKPRPDSRQAAPGSVRNQVFVRGDTGGLGISFIKTPGCQQYSVTSLAPGGAAERSGAIQVGDLIMSVDSTPITDLSAADITSLIVGAPGSSVVLAIAPPSQAAVSVVRGPTGGIGMGFSRETQQVSRPSGLGAVVETVARTSGPYVIRQFVAGSPSESCGELKVGDLLHAVNGVSVYDLGVEQVKALIIGTPGTQVSLITTPAAAAPAAAAAVAPAAAAQASAAQASAAQAAAASAAAAAAQEQKRMLEEQQQMLAQQQAAIAEQQARIAQEMARMEMQAPPEDEFGVHDVDDDEPEQPMGEAPTIDDGVM